MTTRRELSLLETNLNVMTKNLKSMVDGDISMQSVGIKEVSNISKCPEIPVTRFPRWATKKTNSHEDDPFGLNDNELVSDVFAEDHNYQQNKDKDESNHLLLFTEDQGLIISTEHDSNSALIQEAELPFECKEIYFSQTNLTEESQPLKSETSQVNQSDQSKSSKTDHENTEELEYFDLIYKQTKETKPSALHEFYDVKIFSGEVSECVPIKPEMCESYENFGNKNKTSSSESLNITPLTDASFGKCGKLKLQKLKIGPIEILQSKQNILLNKFMRVQKHLKYLSLERLDIERNVFNILSTYNSFEESKSGLYQFNKHLTDIIRTACKEHYCLGILFHKLEVFCSLNKLGVKPVGNILLARFKVTIDGLVLMESFHIIKNDCNLDIRQYPDECLAIEHRFDTTILCIRLIRAEMWSLKQLILDWINKLYDKKGNDDLNSYE